MSFKTTTMMDSENLSILDTKTIGKNISLYRKIKGVKAAEIAERLGITESSYTRLERAETELTIQTLRQIADILKIDPLTLLSVNPGSFLENGNHSPNVYNGSNNRGYYNQTTNEQQTEMMLKLMQNVMAISERLISMLDKKKD
jgi:transcriptional regulator with XRE-family HTH domain